MGMKYDRKTQMMDAGMAFFESAEGLGSVMGIVKAQLDAYGKVWQSSEIDHSLLPSCVGDFDLFLDWSTPWRTRYVACAVEEAGDTGRKDDQDRPVHRYAVSFKEGNRSTPLRAGGHIALAAVFFVMMIAQNFILSRFRFLVGLCFFVLAALTVYRWITPSHKAQRSVKQIISTLIS
jgi:hypothetical protein